MTKTEGNSAMRANVSRIIAVVVTAAAGVVVGWALTRPKNPTVRQTPTKSKSHLERIPSAGPTVNPPTAEAAEARMSSDELVIGLVRNGQALAIRKSSLAAYRGHIQAYPGFAKGLTVLHCDKSNCTRVVDSVTTDFKVVGFHHGENSMIVTVDGVEKSLESVGGANYTETTWGEWKKLHPATKVMDLDGANLASFAERQDDE